MYFAGDTSFGDHFSEIAKRFAPFRVALLPIGAFRPEWFMGEVHCTPKEALDAHRVLRARVSVATHFGTFPLADDGQNEPQEELRAATTNTDLNGSEFWVLCFGEGRDVPAM